MNRITKIKKDFKWEDIETGDILIVSEIDGCESFMAINDGSGNWRDLLYINREDCEYMPAGLSFHDYESCIKYLYPDADELEIRLDRKIDRDDAIEFAYDKGFKPLKVMTRAEIESLLGHKVKIIG